MRGAAGISLVSIRPRSPQGLEPQLSDPLAFFQTHGFQTLVRLVQHRSPYFFSTRHFGQTDAKL